ncbi:MAG: hypothetical protein ACK5KR_02495 [Breznakia sp.]
MKKLLRKFWLSGFCIAVLFGMYSTNHSQIEAARRKYHQAAWGLNAFGWKVLGAHYYVEGDPLKNKTYTQYNKNWANWPNWISSVKYTSYVSGGINYTKMHFTYNSGINLNGFSATITSRRSYLSINF